MPFIGVRLGIPMLSGGGNTTPPAAANDNLMLQFNVASAFMSYWMGVF